MNLDDGDFPNKMLSANADLTSLVLSRNKLTDDFDVRHLFKGSAHSKLASLGLSSMGLTGEAKSFKKLDKWFPNLKILALSGNNIESLSEFGSAEKPFKGLDLNILTLNDNPGAPFEVTAQLQSQNENEIRVRMDRIVPTSTTFRVYGTNVGDDLELTVAAGTRESEWVTLTREDDDDPIYLRAVATTEWPTAFFGLQDLDPSDASLKLYHNTGDGANLLPIVHKNIQSVKMLSG